MTYSNNGNITRVKQDAGGTNSPTFQNDYTYTGLDQLKTAVSTGTGGSQSLFVSEAYTFDSIARMATRQLGASTYPVTYGSTAHMDAPTSYTDKTYSYDANGNQTGQSNTSTGVSQSRSFDPEGRMTKLTIYDGFSFTSTSEYVYDANGQRITNSVTSGGLAPTVQNVTWNGASGVSTGNNEIEAASAITKTGSVSWWDGGAVSNQKISAGSSNSGYAQAVATATTDDTLFGLSTGSTDPGYANIEFGIHFGGSASTPGSIEILESGTSRGWQTGYSAGDVLRVQKEGSAVKYYKNGTSFYTSTVSAPNAHLYFDSSIYTPGARVWGVVLATGNVTASVTRTLYVGSLYEEDISKPNSSGTTAAYTNYYSFGGKLVGMRRGNQPGGANNGQYRIVGDHLGSTTIIVDTASPPSVVQRQYSKPYGELAYQYTASSSSSLTSIGYTGQRLDADSSLMFYNARFYDSVLDPREAG